MKRRNLHGFTLVELMFVVIILSVLSIVAIASYRGYMRKARTQEGVAFLLDIKMKQETYFMTYSRYVDTAPDIDGWFPDMDQAPDFWLKGTTTWDCSTPANDAIRGFCALGIQPQSEMTWFQYVTQGWNPTKTALPASTPQGPLVTDATRRWWFARGQSFWGSGDEMPFELRISNEILEIIEIPPE